MKRILSLSLMVLMLLSSVLGLAACGKMKDNGAEISAYYVGEMYDFDPARAAVDDDAMRVLALLYEPLFRLTEGGKVKPALAERYEIIKDEKLGEYKMEITLKDTMWSDGTSAVTAYDVVFAWKRILDPTFKCEAAPLLYAIEGALEVKSAASDENNHPITTESFGLVADNKETLTVTFRKCFDEDGNQVEPDYDAFLRNLTSVALAPVRQSVVEGDHGAAADYWGKRSLTIVTNGPFTVSTLDFDRGEFTLQRNAYYGYATREEAVDHRADANVKPYTITTDWSKETADLADRFAANSVFIMSDLPLALRSDEKLAKKTEVNDTMSTMSILLNENSRKGQDKYASPLANAAIRRGLSAVIDREAIAELLVYAEPATGFVSHGVFNTNSKRNEFREEGGALLATTATAVETVKADSNFATAFAGLKTAQKTLVLAYNDTEADKAVAEYVETAWEALGFNVTLKALTYNAEVITQQAGDGQTQEFNIRASQLIDVCEDFAIGDGESILAAYRDQKVIPSGMEYNTIYHNDTNLQKVYFDAVIMDYQMLSPDAFTALAAFSTTLNGNGVNLSVDQNYEQPNTRYKHVTGFQNAEYDELIEAAYNTVDADARAALLHEAEALLLEEMPVIPLTFGQCHYVTSNKIKKVSTDYYGYPILTKTSLKNYQKYLETEE